MIIDPKVKYCLALVLVIMVFAAIWIPWTDIRVLASYVAVWFMIFIVMLIAFFED